MPSSSPKSKPAKGKSPRATASAGQSSQASTSRRPSPLRRAISGNLPSSSSDVYKTDLPSIRVREDPPDPASPSNLTGGGPAVSAAGWIASHPTTPREPDPGSSSRAAEGSSPRASGVNQPSGLPGPTESRQPNPDSPSARPSMYISRQELLGMTALKKQAANMRATIEIQEEPILRCQASVISMELMVRITGAKLAQAERSRDNERAIQSFKKQLVEFENDLRPKRKQMHAWNSTGKQKWETVASCVATLNEVILTWEYYQKPEDLKDYLATEKARLDHDKQEIVHLRRTSKEHETRIKELRQLMVKLLPKDFDIGWADFKIEESRIAKSIEAEDAKKRQALKKIRIWERANMQWGCLKELYESGRRPARDKMERMLESAFFGSS